MKTKYIKIFATALLASTLVSCNADKNNLLVEGKIKRETISIAPKLAGRILKIYVEESQIVKKGDTLAILDIPEIQTKMQQVQGILLTASSQYEMAVRGATKEQKNQAIAMYNAALEQYQLAEKSLNRIRNMYKDSLVTAQMYDEALTKFNVAHAQLEAATAKKQEVTGGLRDEQVRMALGQKKQAEGAFNEAQVAINERIIIAPKDMTIETIALHEGELALPGYNLVIGYEVNSTYFRFTISESQTKSFERGQIYEIELPFNNQQVVKARLSGITELGRYAFKSSAYPNYQLGEAVYELKLIPEDKALAQKWLVNATAILKAKAQ